VERLRFVYGTLGFHGTTLQIAAMACVYYSNCKWLKGIFLLFVYIKYGGLLICCNVLTPLLV